MSSNLKNHKKTRARILAILGAFLILSGLIGSLICYL